MPRVGVTRSTKPTTRAARAAGSTGGPVSEVPYVRVYGQPLRDAGFEPGDEVDVVASPGVLVLTRRKRTTMDLIRDARTKEPVLWIERAGRQLLLHDRSGSRELPADAAVSTALLDWVEWHGAIDATTHEVLVDLPVRLFRAVAEGDEELWVRTDSHEAAADAYVSKGDWRSHDDDRDTLDLPIFVEDAISGEARTLVRTVAAR